MHHGSSNPKMDSWDLYPIHPDPCVQSRSTVPSRESTGQETRDFISRVITRNQRFDR